MGEPWEESEVPPGPGEIFGLNDENEMFHARLIKWVRVPSEIPFRQGIEKVQIGIFLDADDLPAYLKGTVRVVWVHNGKREARITLEIAKLLARWWRHGPGWLRAADQRIPVEYLPSACVSFHHQSSFAVEPTTLNLASARPGQGPRAGREPSLPHWLVCENGHPPLEARWRRRDRGSLASRHP